MRRSARDASVSVSHVVARARAHVRRCAGGGKARTPDTISSLCCKSASQSGAFAADAIAKKTRARHHQGATAEERGATAGMEEASLGGERGKGTRLPVQLHLETGGRSEGERKRGGSMYPEVRHGRSKGCERDGVS